MRNMKSIVPLTIMSFAFLTLAPSMQASKLSDWVNRSNQALGRTAARRAFTFQMSKTISVEAGLALGGGRSACSR
jgi:hypothetical protein